MTDSMTETPPDLRPAPVREAMAYFGSWLAFQQRFQRVPAVQAAVRLRDDVVHSSAHGLADVEQQVPLTESHQFRVASHSKTFTATAILQLAERGRLRLDDRSGQWVGYLRDQGSPLADVALSELLAHAAGVSRDSSDGDHWQLRAPFPDEPALREKLLAADSSVLPRNDRFKYSNMGYSLLGLVIEAATGTTYAEAVRTGIIDPLGLRNTGPELDPRRRDEIAVGYSALAYADTRVPIQHVDTRSMAAATGFYFTARDLVDYFGAHFLGDGRLLNDDSKRQMQHPLWEVQGKDRKYALGLSVVKVGRRTLLGHGGGYPGHITSSVADTQARLAVSVLTNAVDGPAESLAHGAVRLIDLACTERPGRAADDPGVQRFAGRFASLWGVTDIAALGGTLYQLDPTNADPVEGAVPLDVVDAATLRFAGGSGYGSYGEPLRYDFADDGSVRSLRGGSGMTLVPLQRFTVPASFTVGG